METSAKDSYHVNDAFITMTDDIIKYKTKSIEKKQDQKLVLDPNKGNDLNVKKSGCC
jgi:hypothetical protein